MPVIRLFYFARAIIHSSVVGERQAGKPCPRGGGERRRNEGLVACEGSRQNPFGERILASDKPENLALGAAAKDDGTRAWLPARGAVKILSVNEFWRATSRKTLPSGRRRKTTERGLGCLRGGTFAKVPPRFLCAFRFFVAVGTFAPATENLQKGFGEGAWGSAFSSKRHTPANTALPRKHSTPPQTHKR